MKNLHRAVRPGGIVLDVHPEPADARRILVRTGANEADAGDLAWTRDFVAAIRKARTALDDCVTSGMFERIAEETFLFREYYNSEESWQQTLDKVSVGTFNASNDLMARARETMPNGRAEIVLEEDVRALVLRRV
ncbi:MAG: hypothetical protein QF554_05290 [Dehalococcoidia bacterium]|nr:hypothetical protein [Dehalococcoidia bacterium]